MEIVNKYNKKEIIWVKLPGISHWPAILLHNWNEKHKVKCFYDNKIVIVKKNCLTKFQDGKNLGYNLSINKKLVLAIQLAEKFSKSKVFPKKIGEITLNKVKKLEPCSNVNFLKQAKNIDTLRNLGIDLEENAPIKFFLIELINKNDIDLITIEKYCNSKKSPVAMLKENNMSYLDEKSTKELLKTIPNCGYQYALELTADTGRTTKNVLLNHFDKIDVLESSDGGYIKLQKLKKEYNQIKNIYHVKAQNFNFDKNYSFILSVGLFANMTDLMTLDFLIKCKKRLEKHGVFIIKENIPNLTFFNNKSSKKCRSLDGYIMLFNLAKLEILKIKKILCCPNSLCEMFEFVLAMRKEA